MHWYQDSSSLTLCVNILCCLWFCIFVLRRMDSSMDLNWEWVENCQRVCSQSVNRSSADLFIDTGIIFGPCCCCCCNCVSMGRTDSESLPPPPCPDEAQTMCFCIHCRPCAFTAAQAPRWKLCLRYAPFGRNHIPIQAPSDVGNINGPPAGSWGVPTKACSQGCIRREGASEAAPESVM